MKTLSERIRSVRKQNGLNQQQFASILGLSQTHISKLENGKDNPSDKVLRIIAVELHINFDWLKTGEGDMHDTTKSGNRDIQIKDCVLPLKKYIQSCSDEELLFASKHIMNLPSFFQSNNYMVKYENGYSRKMRALMGMDSMLSTVTEYVIYINEEYEKILASSQGENDLQDKFNEMNAIKERYINIIENAMDSFFECYIIEKES